MKNINKEILEDLYIKQNLSKKEVCKILNISKGSFVRLASFYNLKKSKTVVYQNVQNKLAKNREVINQKISESNKKVRSTGIPQEKYEKTCLQKYGVDNIAKLDFIKQKAKQTNLEKYGVEHYNQLVESRIRISEIMIKNYATGIPQEKTYQTKKRNGTLLQHNSKQEEQAYQLLLTKFKEEDIVRQYKSELYPFKCDFYIKSLDLYIECQFSKQYHGRIAFDKNNPEHLKRLNRLKYKNGNGKRTQYRKMIKTWTISDPLKRETAKKNNLNWIEFFTLDNFQNWLNSN